MSKIEWCDTTINPVKGLCPVGCSYCYARAFYNRNLNSTFKDKSIRYDKSVWGRDFKDNEKVFVGSTIDLCHEKTIKYIDVIMNECEQYPKTNFIFLTKCSHNIQNIEFPDNCWIGVSTIGFDSRSGLEDIFANVRAKTKFVSIEPLLDYTPMDFRWVDWIIVGQQTPIRLKTKPREWWIRDICERATKEHKPVFLKDNLLDLVFEFSGQSRWAYPNGFYRQQFPKDIK